MPDVIKTVGRYEILRELGRGGMAKVYLARQTDLDRHVALKELGVFHQDDEAFAQRFVRESRVAGSLSHPNIVTVHDYFQHEGTPYIAMEYVEHGSLRPWIGKGKLTLAQVAGVLEGLLAGLAHAEHHDIVHRDLKPENIMITSDGRVKITDFGIAKARNKMQTGAFLTATGTTVGTPAYMAPEQAMAQDVGPWTDIYSVGVMAWEMLVGHVPFHDSEAPMAILLRHVNEPIPLANTVDPEVSQELAQWIDAMLVKDRNNRVSGAQPAWDELEGIVIEALGPRWRRQARLVERSTAGGTPIASPRPLTPAPFEEEQQQTDAGGAWGETPAGGQAPASPPGPMTPPPGPGVLPPSATLEQHFNQPAADARAPGEMAVEPTEMLTFGGPSSPTEDPPAQRQDTPPGAQPQQQDTQPGAPPGPAQRQETPPGAQPPAPPAQRQDTPPGAQPPQWQDTPPGAQPPAAPGQWHDTPPPAAPAQRHDTPPGAQAPQGYVSQPPPAAPPGGQAPPSEDYITAPPLQPPGPPPPRQDAPPPPAAAPPPAEPWTPSEPQQRQEPAWAPLPREDMDPATAEEFAPTVMPRTLPEKGRERSGEDGGGVGRRLVPLVIGGVVVAALVGFGISKAVGGGEEDPEPKVAPRPVTLVDGTALSLRVPERWSRVTTPAPIPGIELESPVVVGPDGRAGTGIVAGLVEGTPDLATLLPAAFERELGGAPEDREAVQLSSSIQAYRYSGLRPDSVNSEYTVYAVPTDRAAAVVVCYAGSIGTFAGECESVAMTLALKGAKPAALGPNAQVAGDLRKALDGLRRDAGGGARELAAARKPTTRAKRAAALADTYRSAGRRVAGLDGGSFIERRLTDQLATALRGVGGGYDDLATAARRKSKRSDGRARQTVGQQQRRVSRAIKGFEVAGYKVG